MTTLFASGYLSHAARTDGEMKTAFETQRDFISERIGAAAMTPLTLLNDGIAPTHAHHNLLPQTGNFDELRTIALDNLPDGTLLLLRNITNGNSIRVIHATTGNGHIRSPLSADLLLGEWTHDWVLLVRQTHFWKILLWDNEDSRRRLSGPPHLFFGSGVDGNVTLTANTTLTRDMYYNFLQVNSGVTLNPNGFKIFVRNQLINNGIISRAGNHAGHGGAATGSNPGEAGTLGLALPAGSIAGGLMGALGGRGGVGGGEEPPPIHGLPGWAGVAEVGYVVGAQSGLVGRAGGMGGAVVLPGRAGGAGGAMGILSTVAATAGGIDNYTTLSLWRLFPSPHLAAAHIQFNLHAGNGGSGGGGGGMVANIGGSSIGGGGGGGGGSGSNGGCILIIARELFNYNLITVAGGNGGNGGAGANGFSFNGIEVACGGGGGGGGNGGNGGILAVITDRYIGTTAALRIAGGTGGAGGAGGTAAGQTPPAFAHGAAGVAGLTGRDGLRLLLTNV